MIFSKKAGNIFKCRLYSNNGFSQIYVLGILLVLILAIPLTVRLTQQSQEMRGRAASSACNSGFRSYDEVVIKDGSLDYRRVKQTVLSSDGKTLWYRNGYWDPNASFEGSTGAYTNWTNWSNKYNLAGVGSGNFLSYNEVVVPDSTLAYKRVKQTLLDADGSTLWYRNGYWDPNASFEGSTGAYTNWTNWSNKYNVASVGNGKFLSYDEVIIPNGNNSYGIDKQTLLDADGKTLWSRRGYWDPNASFEGSTGAYTNWTNWSNKYTLEGIGSGSFVSFDENVLPHNGLPYGKIKQTILQGDGSQLWYRYGYWDPNASFEGSTGAYTNWTNWSNKYNLSQVGCPVEVPAATVTPRATSTPIATPPPPIPTNQPPQEVTLRTPGPGAQIEARQVTFRWDPITNWGTCSKGQVNKYRLYLRIGNSNYGDVNLIYEGTDTSYTENVYPNNTYYWIVSASNGCLTSYSTERNRYFTTIEPALTQPPTTPSVTPGTVCNCSDAVARQWRMIGDYNCDQSIDLKDYSIALINQWRQQIEDLSCSGGPGDDFTLWLNSYINR